MKCPKCHFENPTGTIYCGMCGSQLPSYEEISTKTLKAPKEELTRGTTFADRYEVIEELGKGGMGKVYRVEDKKIKEEVALKIILSEIAVDKKTIERFSNELKMARKISHKNVCRMYDLNEEGGTHYITMEYVAGEDLKSMIKMTKQLSVGTVIGIAKQVCEGLAEAHRLGVVHRDLKSKNIMIDREGNARVMDFGIARSLKTKGITRAGMLIGTPEYMSPEQVEGQEVDQRSDIYSLGVILFEMVTGRVPFEGETLLSIVMKHKSEKPKDPREINAHVSSDISRVILRCMEKDKEERYQSAEELHSELSKIEKGIPTAEREVPKKKAITLKETTIAIRNRWVMIVALFVVVLIAGIGFLYFRRERSAPTAEKKMLVVLPFENLGPPEDEYFAEGITEEITSRLAVLHGLGVISRTSAIQYKKTDKTTKQIGEELSVDYVLEGAVRWDRSRDGKGRVRVTPQLIRVSDDTHLWADRYDRVSEDIFAVQSDIAEQVARQLDLTVLEPERKAMEAKPTDNLEAFDFYLRARRLEHQGWLSSDPQVFERAVQMYEKAGQLDPGFAQVYVLLSRLHIRMYFFGYDHTEERLAKSKAALDRALELQPDLPEAHFSLGLYHYWGLLNYDYALEILESLQKVRPNLFPQFLGYIQRRQGKWEQSLVTLEKAFKLNPRYSPLAYEIGLSYIMMRRYEEAEVCFNRALSIDPDHLESQLRKVEIYVLSKGYTKEALALLETLPQHQLTDYMWFAFSMLERNYEEVLDRLSSLSYDSFEEQHFYFQKNLAYASVYHAKKELSLMKTHADSARLVLEKAIREDSEDPRFQAALGLAHAYLGRKEEAIREGNRAVTLYPVSKDACDGPKYVLNLAKIYTVVGGYEEAIGQLEYLLSIPCGDIVSGLVLRIDPTWDPLREHPKFQSLLEE